MNDKIKQQNREKAKRWRERHPEAAKAAKKRHWEKHHDRNIQKSRANYQAAKEDRQKYALEKYHKDRSVMSNSRLKRLFGITQAQYDELESSQNGLCAICKNPETMKDNKQIGIRKLAVDHCHKTGIIRGLLCFNCNIGLGKFKDSVELLKSALKYMIKQRSHG